MIPVRPLSAAAALLLSAAPALAQPNPFGCHYFRHGAAPHPVMTDASRDQIQETIARSDTFDILHYDIAIDVTRYGAHVIQAGTTVRFKALMPDQDFIRFDLFDLTVDSVTENGEPRTYAYDGAFLRVDFATAPAVDEERELVVYYHGVPHRDPDWGGFYFESNYIYNLGIGISTIPPNFGKVWYPCFDSFVERATYRWHVKSAGTYRLRGQGTFLGETALGGDTVIASYELIQPIPTHISAIAVADYTDHTYVHAGANGDIPVTLSAKPAALGGMVAKFGDLGAAIDACEHWYGPYAYGRVGYVHTTDGALEIPTNVAYPEFMNSQSVQENRALFGHELGHHWWGDIVTPHVHNDMWLKEGPAEYTGHLLEEWLDGEAGLIEAVKDNQLYVLKQAHVNDGGFQPLSPMPDPYIYGTHTYYKGAAVMHNLRGYLGDEVFRQAMRAVQIAEANTTITATEFKEALETATGQDLDPFFDAWVFAPGFAAFEVREFTSTSSGGTWVVELAIGQKLRGTTVYHQQVPVDVTFIAADGSAYDVRVEVGGELTETSVDVPFEPAMVVLNRHARLNQNRMDHEVVLAPEDDLPAVLPYVDMRVYADNVVDTTLLRVEHMWSGPDQTPVAGDVTAISNTHYWNVDGLWPEGTEFRGRLFYYGNGENQLDVALVGDDEYGVCVLHRASPAEPWAPFPGQVIEAGGLTNGTGYINLPALRKGQYTFGKINGWVGVPGTAPELPMGITVFPVPARDRLTVQGSVEGSERLVIDVLDVKGGRVLRTTTTATGAFAHPIDIAALPAGAYVVKVLTHRGDEVGVERFEVVR